MKITWLRALTRRYNNVGYALVAACLLAHFAWQRRRMLVSVCALCVVGLYVRGQSIRQNTKDASAPQTMYAVLDLGALSGSAHSGAYGINNQGQVVGCCHTDYQRWQAFVWQNGAMQELADIGSGNWAVSINAKSQIVGVSNKRAVLWQNGKVQALDVPEQSMARAVNDKGQIVGSFNNSRTAFLWQGGKTTDLGHLPDRLDSYAMGINASGQAVGASGIDGAAAFHAFLWQNGNMLDLGTLAERQQSQANAINDGGVIVGRSGVATNIWHACLWKRTKISDLGTLPFDPHSEAMALNNKGVVVGYVGLPGVSAKRHAFVYKNGKIADLNSHIPADAGWVLERADGINDKGQIVGTGLHNGQRRAFLLTPDKR